MITDEQRKLVADHVYLVEQIAGQLHRWLPGWEFGDLVGAGSEGLIAAAIRYDPSHGVEFSTYAGRRVRGEIIDQARTLRFGSRSHHSRWRAVRDAHDQLEQETGRAPTTDEVAARAELTPAEVSDAYTHAQVAAAPLTGMFDSDGDDRAPMVLTADEKSTSPERAVIEAETLEILLDAVRLLPPRLRVVAEQVMLGDTLAQDVAANLGVSAGRISQLKQDVLTLLRAALTGHLGGVPDPHPPARLDSRCREIREQMRRTRRSRTRPSVLTAA